MRITCIALIVLALICGLFAYWGLHTPAGRSAFDEMAGMVPLAAGVASGFFAACALVVWWRLRS